ncbi:MAG: DUF4124 domain-containing protein [Rhodocyclales bacterium]|nr:DUF4124 domain-containing protein [Rhodocyclales bacterium]
MITIVRCLILACCLAPTLGAAEVYKCKAADGSLRYSDRPCPGTGPTGAPATADRQAAPTLAASGTGQPATHVQPSVSRPMQKKPLDSTARTPLSQRDIDEVNAFKRGFDRMQAEIDDRCRAGDNDYCAYRACDSVRKGAGPAEDFKKCASGYGRPVGSNWIAHGGEAEGMLLPSQVEESRKLRRIYPALSVLVCLRPVGSSAQVSGETYRIAELATLHGGHVFKQNDYGQAWPEYSSIEALAAAVCGR